MAESIKGVTLVVSLHAHAGKEALLHELEARVLPVLREHGGRLEKVIRIEKSLGPDPAPHEVHVLWFPSEAHFESYRGDPRLASLAALRAQAIAGTSILIGHESDAYVGPSRP
jgi:uncharacterized protein (DUF1330 family)